MYRYGNPYEIFDLEELLKDIEELENETEELEEKKGCGCCVKETL